MTTAVSSGMVRVAHPDCANALFRHPFVRGRSQLAVGPRSTHISPRRTLGSTAFHPSCLRPGGEFR
jgi:hypothetical protein